MCALTIKIARAQSQFKRHILVQIYAKMANLVLLPKATHEITSKEETSAKINAKARAKVHSFQMILKSEE